MQDCTSSNKIKENKYKILRMSLLLGSNEDREETLNNFEVASKEIDEMNDEIYLKDLEDKFYDTLNLEEEEKKLSILVDYIGGRVEQRISLLTDFANVTGYDLQGLPAIKYYDKLDNYKERLNYIREYLKNIKQIEKLNNEIESADKKLNEAYINKATTEESNLKNEELLEKKFNNLIKSIDLFNGVNKDNIDEKLSETNSKVEDSKKSLDIFKKSFTTLSNSGISLEEEQEYLSYVEGAGEAFYQNKEQEYLLRIYKLLITKYQDYNNLLIKREELNDILYERLSLRKELRIKNPDILSNIYDLLEKQYDEIKRQSSNHNKIEQLNNIINQKKEILNDLTLENQKVEILALLREFCIIDTYDDLTNNKEESSQSKIVEEEKQELFEKEKTLDEKEIKIENNEINVQKLEQEKIIKSNKNMEEQDESEEVYKNDEFETQEVVEEAKENPDEIKDNQIINVENPNNIDLELVHSKSSKVMQRVGEMLGIKTKETKIVTITNDEEQSEIKNQEELKIDNNQTSVNSIEEIKDTEYGNNNPLFNNNLEQTLQMDPEFEKAINNIDDNNDFWFQSDTPDALNELPDLEISNDSFFTTNNMSDLQFPDLNIDFGKNDLEGK